MRGSYHDASERSHTASPTALCGSSASSSWLLNFVPLVTAFFSHFLFLFFILFANNQQKKKTCPSKRCGEQLEVEQGHLLFEPVDERLAFAQ